MGLQQHFAQANRPLAMVGVPLGSLAEGYAIVSGRFAISQRKGTETFSIRVALTEDGYPALVAALAEGLQQLSQQIAQQLHP